MAGNSNAIINHSPQEAQANGISTVYQEVNLCPNLTVAENLFIGREPRKMGMIDWKQMNERSGKLLESLDIHVPPTQMLEECSIAIQQMIAIARAVDMKCQVLILDEPTSSPLRRTVILSQTAYTCSRKCVTKIIPTPSSRSLLISTNSF